ncbi:MAG TPA: saccharopine dehydrogenase C-terminal domain-containing protein [Bacillota bacterium]|jgi:hypothetical protein
MARTTGYMSSIMVGMLLRGRISARGAVAMEHVFRDGALYAELIEELARRDITVAERFTGARSIITAVDRKRSPPARKC